ncbi:MAG TPA: cytochrome c oxidase subunit II [Gemmatimonadales bacterium]|nr:cytochrome c oxidase subunit II [Gemmatimonadales bacterium]
MLLALQSMSALDTGGSESAALRPLLLSLFIIGGIIWLSVVGVLIAGVRKAPAEPGARSSETAGRWVGMSVALTLVILLVVLGLDYRAGRALAPVPASGALAVEITGHQWWWEVRYPNDTVSLALTTANEIHIPVDRDIELTLKALDVIHSFWLPSLGGKRDLIPGHPRRTRLRAERPGIYDGMCAEYCGLQHAQMKLRVVAQSKDEFSRWYQQQLSEASQAPSPGKAVFLSAGCPMCHEVRGTPAGSRLGPDLTHFASRSTVATGALPRTDEMVRAWIVDPQRFKPGVRMPGSALPDSQLTPLTQWLQGLR